MADSISSIAESLPADVVVHYFAAQETAPGGRIVRTIGIVRARAKIWLAELGL